MTDKDLLSAELIIPFACPRHAHIAYTTLNVDAEPRRDLIRRELSLVDSSDSSPSSSLRVTWLAKEARILRVSINSFIDHLHSVVETIELFDTTDRQQQQPLTSQ